MQPKNFGGIHSRQLLNEIEKLGRLFALGYLVSCVELERVRKHSFIEPHLQHNTYILNDGHHRFMYELKIYYRKYRQISTTQIINETQTPMTGLNTTNCKSVS